MGSRPISPFIERRIFGLAYKAVVSPSCLRCSRMALSGLSCSLHAREESQGGMGMVDVAEFWRREGDLGGEGLGVHCRWTRRRGCAASRGVRRPLHIVLREEPSDGRVLVRAPGQGSVQGGVRARRAERADAGAGREAARRLRGPFGRDKSPSRAAVVQLAGGARGARDEGRANGRGFLVPRPSKESSAGFSGFPVRRSSYILGC
jgi:hypothetical protein